MKNVINFVIFIIYATLIFFLPNNELILICIFINLLIMIFTKTNIKKMLNSFLYIMPFIIFTFVINCILDDFKNAIWISIKLIVVCNITIIYSNTTTAVEIAETIKLLCTPLKIFKINTEDIKIMVCISLSMIPILKNNVYELKSTCKAKNIDFNVKNMKYILSKFFLSIIMRVNQIEESLISKGYKGE